MKENKSILSYQKVERGKLPEKLREKGYFKYGGLEAEKGRVKYFFI